MAVVGGDAGDVVLSFAERRNLIAVFDDRAFARVIPGEREVYIAAEPVEQPASNTCAGCSTLSAAT